VGRRHGGQATFVWVPSGSLAATLSADGQLQTWNLRDPAAPALLDTVVVVDGEQIASCVVASPDGVRLAVSVGRQVSIVLVDPQGRLSVLQQPVLQLQQMAAGMHGTTCRIAWHSEGYLLVCADGAAAVIVSV
jgi:WD40 repeat protein